MKNALVVSRRMFFKSKSASVARKNPVTSIVDLPLKYGQKILPNQLFLDITQTFFHSPKLFFFIEKRSRPVKKKGTLMVIRKTPVER